MILRIIIDVLIAVSLYFAIAGTIGINKMPDTFSRMQASTLITTLGVLGANIGAILYAIFIMHNGAAAVKIAVIAALVGAHAIAKGAYRSGVRPERKMEMDDFRRDFDE